MQQQVISTIFSSHSYGLWGDVCVCSPTGSGKTLSFVIPIVEKLSKTPSHSLRAIVLLPTRELANQIYSVFKPFCDQLHLNLLLATGQTPFTQEHISIIGQPSQFAPDGIQIFCTDILVCTPGRLVDHLRHPEEVDCSNLKYLVIDEADRLMDQEYHGWIEILLSKLDSSQVVQRPSDEQRAEIISDSQKAPSLKSSHIHQNDEEELFLNTLPYPISQGTSKVTENVAVAPPPSPAHNPVVPQTALDSIVSLPSGVSPAYPLWYYPDLSDVPKSTSRSFFKKPYTTLLFSATLTQNPSHFAALRLTTPILIHNTSQTSSSRPQNTLSTQARFSIPPSIRDFIADTPTQNRLLCLIDVLWRWMSGQMRKQIWENDVAREAKRIKHMKKLKAIGRLSPLDIATLENDIAALAQNRNSPPSSLAVSQVLIFADDKEEVHRLSRFLELWGVLESASEDDSSLPPIPLKCTEFSSQLSQPQREHAMTIIRSQQTNIIVASDAMGRGLDVSSIGLVVSYHPPKFVSSYVHRIGRTGRANERGDAVTLVSHDENKAAFKAMAMKEVTRQPGQAIVELPLSQNWTKAQREKYERVKKLLEDVLMKESAGELAHFVPVSTFHLKKNE
ncbi:putative ATP-dependent RNA helicase dbp6 [Blattamonas nauphoetae]|uniref:ATP-dependent RNA helicase n=1 Tax=Blattamonas nauphoetae TaxID=2049346 RepID=A0ABQ9Y4L7_9EUKA|nr:putative ATP-dependent RNA helicase dbp6 [Blattamonas nauphoetae]